jgi:hypothetical protein
MKWIVLTLSMLSATSAQANNKLPQIGEDQLAIFKLQRGFYFSTDVGMFMTFGGMRGYSNVEPFMAIKGGYDINDYLSVQLVASTGFSADNPVSKDNQRSALSYGMFNLGGEVVGAIRPMQRFAIEPRIGAGITRVNPDLLLDNNDSSTFDPHLSGGVDLKYLTLLTDFSAGLSLTGYYILGANIPAASAAFVLRYTF